jgi:hypothetical protein
MISSDARTARERLLAFASELIDTLAQQGITQFSSHKQAALSPHRIRRGTLPLRSRSSRDGFATATGVEEQSRRSARADQVGASAAGYRERTASASGADAIVTGDLDLLAVDPKAALVRGHHAPPARRSARLTRPRPPFRSYLGGPGGTQPPARRGPLSALEIRKASGGGQRVYSASTRSRTAVSRPPQPYTPYCGCLQGFRGRPRASVRERS